MSNRVALATRNEEKAEPYCRALRNAGLEPVAFAPDSDVSLQTVAGLVLSGGVDVDPALYGAVRAPETEAPDRARDDYESVMLFLALERDLPVLAICRGLQLFNVARGGTLIQHLPDTARHRQRTGGVPVHDVVLEGQMADLFGAPKVRVNSRHHQAIDRVGDGLVVTARDPEDGVVEGFVYPAARFAVGVQWHPEDMVNLGNDERQTRLFTAFANAIM
jgi:gamma-glutamyl-gamma-aminobutyrate hydrolase PuuD